MKKVARLKGKKVNGQREKIYFSTHVDFVEGLENKISEKMTEMGGIELSDVTNTVITTGNRVVTLKWTDPDDVIYNGSTLARWAGTKVVRKAGSAPTSVDDGTLIVDNTTKNAYASTAYTDGGLTNNTTYYYRFFPYTTTNTYTMGTEVKAKPTDKEKATMSVSSTSLSVVEGKTANITVNTNSDGAVSAVSADTSIATVSVSGTTVKVTGVKVGGPINITISQAEGTTYASPDEQIVSVTVPAISKVLNENSWEIISEVSLAGDGDLYWDVGDAKEITLNGKIGECFEADNLKLCVFILDFNHKMNGVDENNIIWGGFKSALTDGVDVALIDERYSFDTNGIITFNMNHWGNYNYGGWKGSDLRYDILGATSQQPSDYGEKHTTSCVGYDATAATLTNPRSDTLLAALPSDLRSVMRLWTRWLTASPSGSFDHVGIKRFKRNAIAAYFNIPYGATLELRDDDENGQERGKLSHVIIKALEPNKFDSPQERDEAWKVIWNDPLANKYRRKEHIDYWLWSDDFFNAPIEDLKYIAGLVGVKGL